MGAGLVSLCRPRTARIEWRGTETATCRSPGRPIRTRSAELPFAGKRRKKARRDCWMRSSGGWGSLEKLHRTLVPPDLSATGVMMEKSETFPEEDDVSEPSYLSFGRPSQGITSPKKRGKSRKPLDLILIPGFHTFDFLVYFEAGHFLHSLHSVHRTSLT